jgi:uncharacterized membrane protein
MISVSFEPVGNWYVVAVFGLVVTGLTIWAYSLRMRGTTGAWRWVALGLRLAAVLLCLIAALRPTLVFQKRQKQPSTLIFLSDASQSMEINDEVRGQKRWEVARKTLAQALDTARTLGAGLKVKSYRFDLTLRDDPAGDQGDPKGRETAIGPSLQEALRRESGGRVAAIVLLCDGANNSGVAPLFAARLLKNQQVPVVAVPFGDANAGSKSRDISVRDLVTAPTVFVKNQLQVKGTLLAKGFPNQTVDLDMFVEGQDEPVATQRLRLPEGTEVFPIAGLKYVPQTPGEKKITLRVKPKDGEILLTNNSISTFVTVLKGGLNVLVLQGPHSIWEHKYLMRSIVSSPDIQGDLRIVRAPARRGGGELNDDDFTAGRYDVYILSDLPADFLSQGQQALVARAVDKGAGLIMLGGRSSFGVGGWGATEVGRLLPVSVSPRDGQIEPEGGVKFVPNPMALENFLLQIGPNAAESTRIWKKLPPLTGINHLGDLKANALVFGQTEGDRPEPIMVGIEAGKGRSLAFGGETWVWARDLKDDEGRVAHRKFWRQVIFWLAHKEDKGENEVKLTLDSRRISAGEKLDLHVTAHDAKGAPITGLKYETKVELEGEGEGAPKFTDKVDMFNKGAEAGGTFFASQAPPGDYRVTVVATRDGKEVGRDKARFIVYQDDRELENPAADRALLRQIAEASGGEFLAPEQLTKYLQSLKGKLFTESMSQTPRRVWDNWPFLLLFTALLTLEWWIRKRHGWV